MIAFEYIVTALAIVLVGVKVIEHFADGKWKKRKSA